MIFFDLDGTLVDHRSAVMETIAAIVRAAPDAKAPPDELVALWWSLEARHMREYLAGQCSFAEHHRRRLRSFLPMLGEPVPDDPALLDAWIEERYLSAFEESWQTYPDVRPCLEALKELPRGPRLAVLTNGDPGQQRAKLARFGLLGYFEAVLTPTELGAAKPAAYAAACAWMRTEPARDRTTDRPHRPADPPPRPFAARPVGGDSVQLRQSETELAVELELVEVLTV